MEAQPHLFGLLLNLDPEAPFNTPNYIPETRNLKLRSQKPETPKSQPLSPGLCPFALVPVPGTWHSELRAKTMAMYPQLFPTFG